jgi:Transposase IS4
MSEDDDQELKWISLWQRFHNALKHILLLTNKSLQKNEGKEIELGELLQFFGVVLLITKIDFGQRHELWKCSVVVQVYRFTPVLNLYRNVPQLLQEIWMNLVFSVQPEAHSADMLSVTYQWMLVDYFNQHCHTQFCP